MKLIIDIDEELTEEGHWYTDEELWAVIKAVQNGTPIPDNATNGDAIKAMFPKILYIETVIDEYTNKPTFVMLKDGDRILTNFSMEWWNSPYQKGGKE